MSTRVILLVPLVLLACLQSHGDKRVAVREGDCATCHLVDYDATTMPPHGMAPSATGTVTFPTTCADCHRTTGWQPALSGLHSPVFPIAAGPHVAINCLTCHDLDRAPSSVAGANTNCIQCHPDTAEEADIHAGLKGPMGELYAYAPAVANFCLSCHPTGIALVKHPNDRFPRTGPHAARCTSCHDRAFALPDAAANTTCLNDGCHSLAEEDNQHREEGGAKYTQQRGGGTNRHFCLASGCHPDGRTN